MLRIAFPYAKLGSDSHPVVPIGIHLAGKWRTAHVYVDSGAAYTVLSANLAPAEFDYRRGRVRHSRSATGHELLLFVHDLEIQLGPDRFAAPIAISPDLHAGFNLLGRKGFFNRYKVEFDDRKGIVSFG
ncbi:MAG: hypothetical protein HYT87_07670 [Nitrospirae bacterium]|nr:hypothetical protein [Nitrospirota bacterium]